MLRPIPQGVSASEVRLDRKYKQHGYQDSGKPEKREKQQKDHPRPARQEQIGPRTPRMVGTVLHARCSSCGSILPVGFNANGACPKCGFELHCCKQCVHFDTGAQWECTQPITAPILKKSAKNNCKLFEIRMTVEKDTAPIAPAAPTAAQKDHSYASSRPTDARTAFENLFKK
jgi:predicted RNA-binding Zn-ribbon protein involved in translation (DUF1610 family)